MLVMDQNVEQHNSNKNKSSEQIPIREANNEEKSSKCDQCDYASSHASKLRIHLKTHTGEKPNKCSQCDYASSYIGNLRKHIKKHLSNKMFC